MDPAVAFFGGGKEGDAEVTLDGGVVLVVLSQDGPHTVGPFFFASYLYEAVCLKSFFFFLTTESIDLVCGPRCRGRRTGVCRVQSLPSAVTSVRERWLEAECLLQSATASLVLL